MREAQGIMARPSWPNGAKRILIDVAITTMDTTSLDHPYCFEITRTYLLLGGETKTKRSFKEGPFKMDDVIGEYQY